MSRVQLALNVADLDAAVDFYSKLFGTEPAKRRPGYANFAIAEPPLKLVLIETGPAAATGWPGPSTTSGVEVETPEEVAGGPSRLAATVSARRRGVDHLLLRRAGQGVGQRSGRRALGGLHGARRRHRARPWAARRRRAVRPPEQRLPGGRRVAVGRLRRRRAAERRPRRTRPGQRPVDDASLWRRLLAEFLGSAFLAAVVVGSGIAAQQLSPGNIGLELLRTRRPPPPGSTPSS